MTPDVCLFSRRQVRRFTGWTEFQVRTHLNKLQEMEYILPHYGGRGQSFVYELLFNGEDDGRPQMCGLLDMTTTKTSSIENNGSSMKEAGSSIQRASNEHGSSIWKNGSKPSNQGPSGRNGHQPGENAQEGAENRKAS
ncbi:hypothetical protein [Puniceicoccus vermicola]|uniref:hypothetical protein n=1 Tax=Puniceicoccus vermicola TaxID=388746 RepID=UPI00339A06E1